MIFFGKKGFNVVLTAVLIVVLLLAGGGFYFYQSITTSKTINAFFSEVNGDVVVTDSSGEKIALKDMALTDSSVIRTKADSSAVVVFRESVFVEILENTQVSVSDITPEMVELSVSQGRVWSKFTGLLGLNIFKISTPNGIAQAQGTEFKVSVIDDKTEVLVGEGEVKFYDANQEIIIEPMQVGVKLGNDMSKRNVSINETYDVLGTVKKNVANMRDMRKKELAKHKTLVKQLVQKNNISTDNIKVYLDAFDNGEFDEDEIKAGIPVEVESVDKIFAMTKEIRSQMKYYEELAAKHPEMKSEIDEQMKELLDKSNYVEFLYE